MLFRFLAFLLMCAAVVACNKPDPNPELKDPIYNDLNSRLGSISQQLEAEKKALEGHEAALKEVIPQTGQIKYAQKRVYDSQNKIARLFQEERYLKMKIASRKIEAQKAYASAFKKGEEWPNPQEFASYEAASKLRAAKPIWDTAARVKTLAPSGGKSAGGHGNAEKSEEKKAEASGGHH